MKKTGLTILLLFSLVFADNWHDVRLKANLNTVSMSELTRLPWVTSEMAEAIVKFRTKYGDFNVVDELCYAFDLAKITVDVETLKKNLRLYCVSPNEWASRVVFNYHDLYPYQLQVYTFDTKGILALITLPEGGNLLFGTGSVEDEKAVRQVKEILSRKRKIKKPVIDWLILPDLKPSSCGNLEQVFKLFDVRRVYTINYGKIAANKASFSVLKAIKTIEDRIKPQIFDVGTKIDFLQQRYIVVIDVIYPRMDVNEETSSMFFLRYGEHSFLFAGELSRRDYLDIFKPGYSDRLVRLYSPCVYAYVPKSGLDEFFLVRLGVRYTPASAGVFSSDGVLCYIGDPLKSPPQKKSPYKFVINKKK
jgi:beta-lactamase superfamily II metal-dependent hydrolase